MTTERESLFDALRSAEVVAPDDRSMTKFAPYVNITPATRDAAVSAIERMEEALADCIDITLGHCRPCNEFEKLEMIRARCERGLGIDEKVLL